MSLHGRHHGRPWDSHVATVTEIHGRHATVEIPPIVLPPPRCWWLPNVLVAVTTAVVLGSAVGYAWLCLTDPRPVVLASFGLAGAVHVVVAVECAVLARVLRRQQ